MKTRYKVSIEMEEFADGEKYPSKTEMFTQIILDVDMTKARFLGIVKAVNDLPDYTN